MTINQTKLAQLIQTNHPLVALLIHEGLLDYDTPALTIVEAEFPKLAVSDFTAVQATGYNSGATYQIKIYASRVIRFEHPARQFNITMTNGKATAEGLDFSVAHDVMTISDGAHEMVLPPFSSHMSNGSALRPNTSQSRADLTGVRHNWPTGVAEVSRVAK